MAGHLRMTGVARNHVRIEMNILGSLFQRLNQGGYEVFNSSTRLRVGRRRHFYSDVVVVCGEAMFEHREGSDTLLNPTVIFEVLSPSTEAYDRGKKAQFYRSLPSLSDYSLVAQDRRQLELYSRQPNGMWGLTEATGLHSRLYIPSIDQTLALAEVYQRVQVSEADE